MPHMNSNDPLTHDSLSTEEAALIRDLRAEGRSYAARKLARAEMYRNVEYHARLAVDDVLTGSLTSGDELCEVAYAAADQETEKYSDAWSVLHGCDDATSAGFAVLDGYGWLVDNYGSFSTPGAGIDAVAVDVARGVMQEAITEEIQRVMVSVALSPTDRDGVWEHAVEECDAYEQASGGLCNRIAYLQRLLTEENA